MSLTTTAPVLPGFMPGRSSAVPVYPVRGPGYSIKATPVWSNSKQQSVSGRTIVIKYWANPKWQWEWIYDVILDNPSNQNPYYTGPIPYTDFQIISSFWNACQGQGNEFLFQPPDSVVGGSGSATAVQGTSNFWTITTTGNWAPGLYVSISGFSTATWLNGQTLQILSSTSTSIVVYFVHGNLALTADSATLKAGQLLSAVDANNNTELVHMIGGYPTIPLTGTPSTTTQVTESVQVIESTSLAITANGSGVSASILPADTVDPYQGLVLHFGSPPATPLIASYTYYYVCRFSDDNITWENFMSMLWLTQSFKFEKVVI